jgi:SAM-dependent methyltransferase
MADMYPKGDLRDLPRATKTEMASRLLELNGKRVVDIGCGAGDFTIFLARQGARVTGIDPNEARIEQARAAADAEDASADFKVGIAEDLPFADSSIDIVVFSNSLHHVPEQGLAQALREAARVLKPGGKLYVTEPLPAGGHYELRRVWSDETGIRTRAYEELQGAVAFGLVLESETFYGHPARYENFEGFVAERNARSARDAELLARHREEVQARFEKHAWREDGVFMLDQATRINVLVKAG